MPRDREGADTFVLFGYGLSGLGSGEADFSQLHLPFARKTQVLSMPHINSLFGAKHLCLDRIVTEQATEPTALFCGVLAATGPSRLNGRPMLAYFRGVWQAKGVVHFLVY